MDRNTTYGYFRAFTWSSLAEDDESMGYMCIRLDRPPKENQGVGEYKASFSFCSPVDVNHFTKKLARKIADARMNTKRIKKNNIPNHINFNITEQCPKLISVFEKAIKVADSLDMMPEWVDINDMTYGLKDYPEEDK